MSISCGQFEQQAATANRQIVIVENTNLIDFLHLMQESNMYLTEEMKTKFGRVEKTILGGVGEEEYGTNLAEDFASDDNETNSNESKLPS